MNSIFNDYRDALWAAKRDAELYLEITVVLQVGVSYIVRDLSNLRERDRKDIVAFCNPWHPQLLNHVTVYEASATR